MWDAGRASIRPWRTIHATTAISSATYVRGDHLKCDERTHFLRSVKNPRMPPKEPNWPGVRRRNAASLNAIERQLKITKRSHRSTGRRYAAIRKCVERTQRPPVIAPSASRDGRFAWSPPVPGLRAVSERRHDDNVCERRRHLCDWSPRQQPRESARARERAQPIRSRQEPARTRLRLPAVLRNAAVARPLAARLRAFDG
jgi:hypothetical protein